MTATLLKLPTYFPDTTSRLYCSALYLDEDLARWTFAHLCVNDLDAVAPAPGIDLVAVGRHATRARRLRRARHLTLTALLALTIAATAGALLAGLGRGTMLLVAGLLAVAYGVYLWKIFLVLRTAVAIMSDRDVAVADAEPLDPAVEERLELANRGNVIVYSAQLDDPFIGSGHAAAGHRVIGPVDVGTPLDGRTTRRFTARQLHDHLAEAIPRMGLEGVTCEDVLYVHGHHAPSVPGVAPDELAAPRGLVSEDVLAAAGRAPGAGARSYLCIRVIGPGALHVATVHVRIQLVRERLSWHMSQHVLTPLPRRYRTALDLGQTPGRALRGHLLHSPGAFVDAFLRAPSKLYADDHEVRRERKRLRRGRKAIKKGHGYDYGASYSARPCPPASLAELSLLEMNDVKDYLARAVHAVFTATVEFLEAHDVNCYELRQQEMAITNNIFNGDMRGSQFAEVATMHQHWSDAGGTGAQRHAAGATPHGHHGG